MLQGESYDGGSGSHTDPLTVLGVQGVVHLFQQGFLHRRRLLAFPGPAQSSNPNLSVKGVLWSICRKLCCSPNLPGDGGTQPTAKEQQLAKGCHVTGASGTGSLPVHRRCASPANRTTSICRFIPCIGRVQCLSITQAPQKQLAKSCTLVKVPNLYRNWYPT